MNITEEQNLIRSAKNGTAVETVVIRLLNRFCHGVYEASSREDNMQHDIDIIRVDKPQTFSVKSGTKPEDSGCIAFETAVFINGAWKTSWYHTGTAKYYLFVLNNTIWSVPKKRITRYVREHGFERICHTRASTIALLNKHHPHKKAQLGLLRMETLCKIGMIPLITLENDDEDYMTLCELRYGDAKKSGKPHPKRSRTRLVG